MKKIILLIIFTANLFVSNASAQKSFEDSLRVVRSKLFFTEVDSVEKSKLRIEYAKLREYRRRYNGWPFIEDTTHFTTAFRQKMTRDSAFRLYRGYVIDHKYSDSFRSRALYAINDLHTVTADSFLFATIGKLCCIAGMYETLDGLDKYTDPSFEILKSRGADLRLLKTMFIYMSNNVPNKRNLRNEEMSHYNNAYEPFCRLTEGILGIEKTIPWIKQQMKKQGDKPLLLKNLQEMLACEEYLQALDLYNSQWLKH